MTKHTIHNPKPFINTKILRGLKKPTAKYPAARFMKKDAAICIILKKDFLPIKKNVS